MITIKELKEFLAKLPEEFDNYTLVNAEFGIIDEEHSYRLDKPIIGMVVDEDTCELALAHQKIDGDD